MIPATLDFFRVLGVAPSLGRVFQPDDLKRGCTVVLDHRFWTGALAADPHIAGQSLRFDDLTCTVAGVMPASFVFFPERASLWMLLTPASPIARDPDRGGIGIFGRLRPGVSAAAAEEELKRIHQNAHAKDSHGQLAEPLVRPLGEEFTWLAGRNLRLSVLVLAGAVCFVLLIACVNVANLSLGRALARRREFAVRAALGSGQLRLVRQPLTESFLLSVLAAGLGVGLAWLCVYYFRLENPIGLPPGAAVHLNGIVLLFSAGLAVVTTLLFGLLPAWKASRPDLATSLKASAKGSSQDRRKLWLAKALVVAEIALSVVLLVGAALLIQSVSRFASVPLGFSTERLLTLSLAMPRTVFAKAETRVRFYEELLARLRMFPEIQGAAIANAPPVQGVQASGALSIAGRPDPAPNAALHDVGQLIVSSGYFSVMGIPLRSGRAFDARDRDGSPPTAVVNEALARKYFPGQDPTGQQVRIFGEAEAANPWLTVVGVSADEKRATLAELTWQEPPTIYRASGQRPPGGGQLILRLASDRASMGAAVQRAIYELNPNISVTSVTTGEKLVAQSMAYPRFRAAILGGFSAMALLLAVVGLYGVLSQLVLQRTSEIGVRMALGARRRDVLRMVVLEGMWLAAAGVVAGLAGAWWLSQFLAALLYGVGATDPATLAIVTCSLLLAALVAVYLPARRATRLDPVVALRYE